MQGIYSITNTANGLVYIGSAVGIEDRWYGHRWALARQRHCNGHLQRAWNKYGGGAFTFAVVELVADKDQLEAREDAMITATPKALRYNIAERAGRGPSMKGWKHTPKACANMAAAQRGRKHTAETRAKISASWRDHGTPESRARSAAKQRGRKRVWSPERRAKQAATNRQTWLGRKHSAVSLARMAAAKVGKKASNETSALLSRQRKGVPKTSEHRARIAAGRRGLHHSVETRVKMSAGQRAFYAAMREGRDAERWLQEHG